MHSDHFECDTSGVRLDFPFQPIADSDDDVRKLVADAAIPPLLASVAHLTGDLSILTEGLRPDLARLLEPDNGYSADQLETARNLASGALIAYRDRGSLPAPPPTLEQQRAIMDFLAGGKADDELVPLYREELALDGTDHRAPSWSKVEVAGDREFVVGIIGAGMSGIVAAHRLRQAGVDVIMFEKNNDVGGTWFENTYPGCRVDVANHFYSYSFAQTGHWPQFFSQRPVLLDYFRSCVEQFGLRELIRFNHEVLGSEWEPANGTWKIRTRSNGVESTTSVHALISATGQLNQPLMPDIEGIGTFTGPAFHSARWDAAVDLVDKNVVVIGTGASAVQFIPSVAEQAASLTVFQRTPPWLLPVPQYQDDLPDGLRWLLNHVPQFARWDRLWIVVRTQEGLLPLTEVDPDWPVSEQSVGPMNDFLRQMLTAAYVDLFPDESIRSKVIPAYPPVAKRVVLDNGSYARALQRPNVRLETTGIERITSTGVRTVDGVEHHADVIIYGTGFQASKFLTPMTVKGEGGVDLHERWAGDARAYLGIVVPEFPNFFMMYGPNTNIVINGSIIYYSECEANFIVDSVRMLLESKKKSMVCRPEVHDAYNVLIDEGNRKRAWGASKVNSWYKNEHGRVAQNWPFNMIEYWKRTRSPNPNDFLLS